MSLGGRPREPHADRAGAPRTCPRPSFTGVRVLRRRPAGDAARVHRLDAVLPHLGAEGGLPAHPRAREVRRAGPADLRRGERAPRRDRRRRSCSRRAASTASSRPTPWATTSSSTPTPARAGGSRALPLPAPAGAPRTTASRARSPRRLHRARGDRPPRSPRRLRRHHRDRPQGAVRRIPGRSNDDYNAIMAEALADRLAEAFAEYLHKRGARRVGLRHARGPDQGAAHRRGVPRHPPGRRLPGLPGSHREGDALAAARRREAAPACC